MSLKGNLSSVNLTEIFQMLSLSGREGTLFIYEGPRKRAVCFTKEGVSLRSRERNESILIGKILVRMGKLDEKHLREAVDTRRTSDQLIGDVLVDRGFCTREDVELAFRIQSEEEIQELFLNRVDAQFEYVDGFFPESSLPYVNLNVNALLIEIARRTDEWEYIRRRIRGPREIYQFTGTEGEMDPDTLVECHAARIDPLIDGQHSVREVIEKSYVGKFEACKLLAAYLDAGVIELVPRETIRQNASLALRMGDAAGAIRHFEYLMSTGDFPLELMGEAAAAHEANRDYGEAASLLRRYAEELVREGDADSAVRVLHRIANYPKPEPEALRYLLDVVIEFPRTVGDYAASIVEAGKTLLGWQMQQENFHEALELARRLARLFPDEVAFPLAIVNIHYDEGMSEKAISECEVFAASYLKRRHNTGAVTLYKKLLVMDPGRADVRERIRKLVSGSKRRRSSGTLARLAVAAAVMLLLGGVAIVMVREGGDQPAAATGGNALLTLRERATGDYGAAEEHGARAVEEYERLAGLLGDDPIAHRDELTSHMLVAEKRYELFRERHDKVVSIARTIRSQTQDEADASHARALLRSSKEIEDRVEATRERWRRRAQEAAEDLFRGALKEYEGGEHRHALAGLELAHELATNRTWLQDAGVDRYTRDIRGTLRRVEQSMEEARGAEERHDIVRARQIYLELLGTYEGSDLVRDLRLPLEVLTLPAGAAVTLEGEALPELTPMVLRVSPFGKSTITLARDGFRTLTTTLGPFDEHTDASQATRQFVLERAEVWSYPMREPIEASPAAWDGHVAVAGRSGKWVVLDAGSGSLLRKGETSTFDGVSADLATDGRHFFVPALDGTLFAFDTGDGNDDWKVGGLQPRLQAPPAIHESTLYLVDQAGNVTAVDLDTRTVLWTQPKVLPAVLATPVYQAGHLVLLSVTGEVAVIDTARKGAVVVRFSVPGSYSSPPVPVNAQDLVFCSEAGVLVRVNRVLGEVAWTLDLQETVTAPCVLRGNKLFVSPQADTLLGVDVDAGVRTYRWVRTAAAARVPLSNSDRIYFVHGTTLSAFGPGPEGYGLAWTFEAKGPILSGPVVHDDAIYLGDEKGNLYRLRGGE